MRAPIAWGLLIVFLILGNTGVYFSLEEHREILVQKKISFNDLKQREAVFQKTATDHSVLLQKYEGASPSLSPKDLVAEFKKMPFQELKYQFTKAPESKDFKTQGYQVRLSFNGSKESQIWRAFEDLKSSVSGYITFKSISLKRISSEDRPMFEANISFDWIKPILVNKGVP